MLIPQNLKISAIETSVFDLLSQTFLEMQPLNKTPSWSLYDASLYSGTSTIGLFVFGSIIFLHFKKNILANFYGINRIKWKKIYKI